eukprot:2928547-Heterocapsa_arctica.AAC.1
MTCGVRIAGRRTSSAPSRRGRSRRSRYSTPSMRPRRRSPARSPRWARTRRSWARACGRRWRRKPEWQFRPDSVMSCGAGGVGPQGARA